MAPAATSGLYRLAALHGVQTAYFDVSGRRRRAAPEALIAVLRALGEPITGLRDVPAALRERENRLVQRLCDTVTVAWDGRNAAVSLRLPAGFLGPVACSLRREDGRVREWTVRAEDLVAQAPRRAAGRGVIRRRLRLPERLPPGYHRLEVRAGRRSGEVLLLAAPRAAFVPAAGAGARTWGVFLPLYALQSARSWGSGDFSDLAQLMEWVQDLGGGVVATLPVLAAFLADPCEPSPYMPASRLFWNEFYLDPTRTAELARCPAAQELMASPALQDELAHLRRAPLVDYRRAMRAKRRVLEALAACFFAGPAPGREEFARYLRARPEVEDYARFRAAGERLHAPWPAWPPRPREGDLRSGDGEEAVYRYHLYVQWQAEEQVAALSARARGHGPGLYLDLPLGVHPDGYDVWRERDLFVRAASGGAPPDAFFTKGQDWGFPPMHPERLREQHLRHFIAVIRHHLRHAGVLRIDHVMGLHRLFWVPRGMEARDGVYVRYPAAELYAVLTLESHRHAAVIVGEDLGTVPPVVRRTMDRHRVQRMYVVQYEVVPGARTPLPPVTRDVLAGLNTHDMPSFAAFWEGADIADRVTLDLLDERGARRERDSRRRLTRAVVEFLRQEGWLPRRSASPAAVLRALLAWLGASDARIVVAGLEDLWLEAHPQNVPGTGGERPNWRRKSRRALEEFTRDDRVRDMLAALHGRRVTS